MTDRYWLSDAPTRCDVTGEAIADQFIDGRSRQGPWGFFTPTSWAAHGCGRLGTGFGQRYERQPDGRYKKVEG